MKLKNRCNFAHPSIALFVGVYELTFMLKLKDWSAPKFEKYWHENKYYGWSISFGPFMVLS